MDAKVRVAQHKHVHGVSPAFGMNEVAGIGSAAARVRPVGGAFSDDFIALKMQEVARFRTATHPLE